MQKLMMSVLPAVLGQVIFIINNKLVLHKAWMTNDYWGQGEKMWLYELNTNKEINQLVTLGHFRKNFLLTFYGLQKQCSHGWKHDLFLAWFSYSKVSISTSWLKTCCFSETVMTRKKMLCLFDLGGVGKTVLLYEYPTELP